MRRERIRLRAGTGGGGNYFAAPKLGLQFTSSGCKTLDLALGGGWVEDRIINIVGDKATGKTLLAIEATANFAAKYPKGKIRYRESEAAFDKAYANAIGMPVDRVDFGEPMETVEDLFEDLTRIIKGAKQPELFICDSLDALSDRAEMERSMDQGTYGAEKAKKMSQLFRRLVRLMKQKHVTLIIISQVRDKIGVTFGRKTTRTGGHALDFYASQVVYLAHIATLQRKARGVKRPSGVEVRAKLDKNKVGLPFREAQFPIMFGYGIDDVAACLEWLKEVGSLRDVGYKDDDVKFLSRELMRGPAAEQRVEVEKLHKFVELEWYAIEKSLLPKRSKYGG
jgi:recombination protein RecA